MYSSLFFAECNKLVHDRGIVVFNGKTYSNIRYSDEAPTIVEAAVADGAVIKGADDAAAAESPDVVELDIGAVDAVLAVEGAGAIAPAAVGEAGFVAGAAVGAGFVDNGIANEGEEVVAGAAGLVAAARGDVGRAGGAYVVPVVGEGVVFNAPNDGALVRNWLLTFLPGLNNNDIEQYSMSLIDMGFYSVETFGVITPAELGFMKVAHRRVVEHRLNGIHPNHS
mmetsp:Transcript_19101/g.39378  ORF Transcript_19101/g.39378 Transcript_19101/m.39378 type:complete len:224 (+) Transcript_19101:1449-2120(+)